MLDEKMVQNHIDLVKNAGVIGAGGAGFPTHTKLSANADIVILNGAECEPLLRVDQQLMEVFAKEVVLGLELARNITKAKKAIIGIKAKHGEAVAALEDAIRDNKLNQVMEIGILKDAYPAGDEQILVYELTGRIVPEAGIPINCGIVVINTETAINIYQAIKEMKPVTKKYLTVAGNVPNPVTLTVPVGTPLRTVFSAAGVDNPEDYFIIDGGPMMGAKLNNIDGFITKKSKGYIFLAKDHPLASKKNMKIVNTKRINKAACEQCRMCTDLCPRNLIGHDIEPHMSMRILGYNLEMSQANDTVYLCSQCSLCELFSCPEGLYPKSANLYIKSKLIQGDIRFEKKEKEYRAKSAREYRQVSTKRLVKRLRLSEYDVKAPLNLHLLETEKIGLYFSQHVGAPSVPIVKKGDSVVEGMEIANIPDGSLGIKIHTSISGIVEEINDKYIVIRREMHP